MLSRKSITPRHRGTTHLCIRIEDCFEVVVQRGVRTRVFMEPLSSRLNGRREIVAGPRCPES